MNSSNLTSTLKLHAQQLGFEKVGICPAVTPTGLHHFHEWLAAGYAGEMHYLPDRKEAYAHPKHVMNGARSLVLLATNYNTVSPKSTTSGKGSVSRYAWGEADYHDVIHKRLKSLATWVQKGSPDAKVRGIVDTAPLHEREFAQLAGLGWVGKNTLLLSRDLGSYFFLAVLLTDIELEYDAPFEADHCGTCTACLDACPTDAFVRPYVLNATRCISYLTIEKRGTIPEDLREGIGDWLFGCDACQTVCPWNNHAPSSLESTFMPREGMDPVDLASLFYLDDEAFRARFRKTPLWRTKRRGILRNAAIVLGNQQCIEAIPALELGRNDSEIFIREACDWALMQMPSRT